MALLTQTEAIEVLESLVTEARNSNRDIRSDEQNKIWFFVRFTNGDLYDIRIQKTEEDKPLHKEVQEWWTE